MSQESSQGGIEGRLFIRVRRSGKGRAAVDIHSTRPLSTPRIFTGKTPRQVLSTLPLLYSVCGTAQGCAAVEALEQASGESAPPEILRARRAIVLAEIAREHLWRIELDWSAYLGTAPRKATLTEAADFMDQFRKGLFPNGDMFEPGGGRLNETLDEALEQVENLEDLLRRDIFSQSPEKWLALGTEEQLDYWARGSTLSAAGMLTRVTEEGLSGLGRAEVSGLPLLSVDALEKRFKATDAEAFIEQPTWQGNAMETTAYTRQNNHPLLLNLAKKYGNGLKPRLTARLIELGKIPGRLRSVMHEGEFLTLGCGSSVPGTGISQLEASRGRLIHRVELDEGIVKRYRILAPTEWNFHRHGVLVKGLSAIDAESIEVLRRNTGLLVSAIDPCVGYSLEIS